MRGTSVYVHSEDESTQAVSNGIEEHGTETFLQFDLF